MEKIISNTLAKQDQKMRERMEKREKALAEGKTLEQIEQEEQAEDAMATENNSNQNGSQALNDLQQQFEAEKEAILKLMKSNESRDSTERERQLALARLRRDKMKIKREEKYDGAALVLGLAKSNQAKKNERYQMMIFHSHLSIYVQWCVFEHSEIVTEISTIAVLPVMLAAFDSNGY